MAARHLRRPGRVYPGDAITQHARIAGEEIHLLAGLQRQDVVGVFDAQALQAAPGQLQLALSSAARATGTADFKAPAAAVAEPQEMWPLQAQLAHLARKQREIERKCDYRYSQLLLVFARLIRDGRVQEAQLAGLSEEKRADIHCALTGVKQTCVLSQGSQF